MLFSPAIRFISEEMYMMLQPQQIYVCVVLLLISPMRERERVYGNLKKQLDQREAYVYIYNIHNCGRGGGSKYPNVYF